MDRVMKGWMVLGVLLGTMGYAIAEDLILTTYYPSPRGVYNELRFNQATASGPGNLHIQGGLSVGSSTPGPAGSAVFSGGVGIGTASVGGTGTPKLTIDQGDIEVVNSANPLPGAGQYGLYFGGGRQHGFALINNAGSPQLVLVAGAAARLSINQAGEIGMGTSPVAGTRLHVGGDIQITGGDLVIDQGRGLVSGNWSVRPMVPRAKLGSPTSRDSLAFYANSTSITQPALLITDQGNVGIGTLTPNNSRGSNGFLDVRDVFLRNANRWASDPFGGVGNSFFYQAQAGSNATQHQQNGLTDGLWLVTVQGFADVMLAQGPTGFGGIGITVNGGFGTGATLQVPLAASSTREFVPFSVTALTNVVGGSLTCSVQGQGTFLAVRPQILSIASHRIAD